MTLPVVVLPAGGGGKLEHKISAISFLTHEDKVQVMSMEGEKFLCVSSKFDCFLTNGYCFFYCFSTKNSRDHALRLSLCSERALFKSFI